ncbi:peptide chain release factor N(5)-glutamine methyltransferase [Paenibacillus sp. HJGM_3]|uniref:peptide chain release factor N(5)-glutamine methyltransferase n=1 Tax=Paenibacillus sp. HJGM_3 TaxID=3379816 RepID=UPI00385E9C23
MSTIREAYLQASSFLQRADVRDAAIVTELLLCHLMDWSRTELFLRWGEPFPADREEDWAGYVLRKASGEPVQYIIGEQEFYGLRFHVEQAVLIPRPETELLVEEIVRTAGSLWREDTPLVVADIGTGSGAIAVTLAVQRPAWRLQAVDLSPAALEVAKGNAKRNGVVERVAFHEGDLLGPFLHGGDADGLDIVVSNPPYIESEAIEGLEVQVRCYEPHLALDGGPDGLALYRRLTEQLTRLERTPRIVGFEVGQGQAPAVAELLTHTGLWAEVRLVKDLAGIERHVIAVRR